MDLVSNDLFYSRLPVNEIPLGDLLTEEHLFFKIPGNWQVVITDVRNSTAAVRDGLHETVNSLGNKTKKILGKHIHFLLNFSGKDHW